MIPSKRPDTLVKAVTPEGEPSDDSGVDPAYIDLGSVFLELGLTPERFTEWTFKFGADSLGVSPQGDTLLPDFPTFSMIAWVDVDPVLMGTNNLVRLVDECSRLAKKFQSTHALSECKRIQDLAARALAHRLFLKFDHA